MPNFSVFRNLLILSLLALTISLSNGLIVTSETSLDHILKNFPEKQKQLSSLHQRISEYHTGIFSDSHETNADLEQVNSLTMIETNCGVIKDIWVLNSVNCTQDMGEKFSRRDNSDWSLGRPTCLGLKQWMSYGEHNIAERYEIKDCMDRESRRKMRMGRDFVEEFVISRRELEESLFELIAILEGITVKYEGLSKELNNFSKISNEIENGWRDFDETLSKIKGDFLKKDFQDSQQNFFMNQKIDVEEQKKEEKEQFKKETSHNGEL